MKLSSLLLNYLSPNKDNFLAVIIEVRVQLLPRSAHGNIPQSRAEHSPVHSERWPLLLMKERNEEVLFNECYFEKKM